MIQAAKFQVDPGWNILFNLMGINTAEVLKHAQLPDNMFSDKNMSLSVDEYFNLWNSLVSVSNDSLLPLKAVEFMNPGVFHPISFASLCSPNFNVALKRIEKYKRLVGPLAVNVIEKKNKTIVEVDCLYKTNPIPDSLAAFELVFLLYIGRTALRKKITPVSVSTTSEILLKKEYKKYFNCPIEKGVKNQLIVSAHDANSPFITENPDMWSFFEPELRKKLSDFDVEMSFSSRVRNILFELLPSGMLSADEVARRMGISKRTVQRNLNNEKTSFQEELNKTRENLALHYFKNSQMTCEEISFLLGYDDPGSFVRAYKTWTGKTPGKVIVSMRH